MLALMIAAAIDVTSPPGCVDPVEVSAAVDEVGGIDVAESVVVKVTPSLDEYVLIVDIALVQAEPLHREVPLRARECADVASLVAVLVDGQRRAALEARLMAPPPPDPAPAPKEAPRAMDPRTKPADFTSTPASWSPCDGPPNLGGFRFAFALGGSFPLGSRAAVDTGWDLTPSTTIIALGDVHQSPTTARTGGAAGVAYRLRFDVLELSLRGLVGGGFGDKATKRVAAGTDIDCLDEGGASTSTTGSLSNWYFAPQLAVRGRIGYVFAEAGTTWHVGLDELPAAYLAIGFNLFGA